MRTRFVFAWLFVRSLGPQIGKLHFEAFLDETVFFSGGDSDKVACMDEGAPRQVLILCYLRECVLPG